MLKGTVIGGEFGKVMIREKNDSQIQLGELLIAQNGDNEKILLQAYDLLYGSQLSQHNLELISGMHLEEDAPLTFMDPKLRNYRLGLLKTLVAIKGNQAYACKSLPRFFSPVRAITKDDLTFFSEPKHPLEFGKLRSGSQEVDITISLDGRSVFSEHILISASTGKGKSNLMSCLLWNCVEQDYCGMLVLDPHDEYFGRSGTGLTQHPRRDKVVYYSPYNPPSGARTLKINIAQVKPQHFLGVTQLSDAQQEAIVAYYKKFKENWVVSLLRDEKLSEKNNYFHEGTIAVVKRKLINLLDITLHDENISFNGVFSDQAGETTIKDISNELEKAHTVVIDTSHFASETEILIGSLIASELFRRYKRYTIEGIKNKPVISIVLEEAPRVIGKEVLQQGQNIFGTIAREGRKFNIGLVAITQLPSLIPREILANMNTKIILGMEMAPERKAIIESAAQDLSKDDRNIASLDKGEAILSSNFTKFAIPIKIALFDSLVAKVKKESVAQSFLGVNLG